MTIVAAATLLLAACAPAAGSQSSVPVRAGTEPIPADKGQTVFVRVDFTLDEFDMDESDMGAALWVPSGYASAVGDVTSYFSLRDVQGATGWQISLSRMRLERSTVTNQSFGSSTTTRELWAELRLKVPEDAIPGVYRVRANVQARSGVSRPLTVRLDVRP